eukprot:jgi/Mesvir1/25723/Mv01907-RA.2
MTITLRKIEEEFRKLDQREAFMREYYAPGKPIRNAQQNVGLSPSKFSSLDAAECTNAARMGTKPRRAVSAHPSSPAGSGPTSSPAQPRLFSAGPSRKAYGQPVEESPDKTKRPAGVPARQRPVSSPGKFANRLRQTIFDPVGEAAAAGTSPRTLNRTSSLGARPGDDQPSPSPPPPLPPPEPVIPPRFRKQKHWFAYTLEEGDKVSIYGLNLGQQLKQGLAPGSAGAGAHPALDGTQPVGLDDWRLAAEQAWANIPEDASGVPGYLGQPSRPLSSFHPSAGVHGTAHLGGTGAVYSATDAYQRSLLTDTGRMGRSLHLLREELGHTNVPEERLSPTAQHAQHAQHAQQRGGGALAGRPHDEGEGVPGAHEGPSSHQHRKGQRERANRPSTAHESRDPALLSKSLPPGRSASARRASDVSDGAVRDAKLNRTMTVDRRGSLPNGVPGDDRQHKPGGGYMRAQSAQFSHPGVDAAPPATSPGHQPPGQQSFRIVSATARPLSAALGPLWASSASIKDRAGGRTDGRDSQGGARASNSGGSGAISDALLPAQRYEGEATEHSGSGGSGGGGAGNVGPAEAWQVPRGSFKKNQRDERAMVFVRRTDGVVAPMGGEYPVGRGGGPGSAIPPNALVWTADGTPLDAATGQPYGAVNPELRQGHPREPPQDRFVAPPASYLSQRPRDPPGGGIAGFVPGLGLSSAGVSPGSGSGGGRGVGARPGSASVRQKKSMNVRPAHAAEPNLVRPDSGREYGQARPDSGRHQSWVGGHPPVPAGDGYSKPVSSSSSAWQDEGEKTPRLAGALSHEPQGRGEAAAPETEGSKGGESGHVVNDAAGGGCSGVGPGEIDNYDNPDCEEYYFLNIGVHQDRVLSHWQFDVFVTDKATGNRVQVAENAKVNRENSIIFQEPDETTLSPARMLPWVRQPRDLLGRSLVVEAISVVPREERVVQVSVHYGENSAVQIVDQLQRPKSPSKQHQLQLWASAPLSPKSPRPAPPPPPQLQAYKNAQFGTTLLVATDARDPQGVPASPRAGRPPTAGGGSGSGKREAVSGGGGPATGTVVSPRHHPSRQSLESSPVQMAALQTTWAPLPQRQVCHPGLLPKGLPAGQGQQQGGSGEARCHRVDRKRGTSLRPPAAPWPAAWVCTARASGHPPMMHPLGGACHPLNDRSDSWRRCARR